MIQVLKRADDAIRIISQADEIPLARLASQMGLRKTTLSNILATLISLGYVRRSALGRYSLGEKFRSLSYPLAVKESVVKAGETIVNELAARTGEQAVCSMIQNGKIALVARAESSQTLTVNAKAFEEYSAYGTASGRVLLANLDPWEQDDFIDRLGMPGDQWNGIKAPDYLRYEMCLVRDAGIAEKAAKDGQAHAMAMPVFGPDKRVWAALGLCLPTMRYTDEKKETIPAELKAAAERMSHLLANNS
ncbi:MAG: IclR family transcriptional regulator [Planctomycetes bacterium]|nr:IclR family transcriptional regulator [Planctomycetota bacterium]